MRPNELRDSFANLLSDVCHDIETEPHLQPVQLETFALKSTTTANDARFDIKANNKTYFNMKIFTRCQKVALNAEAKPTNAMNLLKKKQITKIN